jgi:hypothetical protein
LTPWMQSASRAETSAMSPKADPFAAHEGTQAL